MTERRKYTARMGTSGVGRTTIYITCPFCGVETMAYLWSLAGSGKLCSCGAKHTYMGGDTIRGGEKTKGSVSEFDALIVGYMSDGNSEEDVAQILGRTRRHVHFRLQRLRRRSSFLSVWRLMQPSRGRTRSNSRSRRRVTNPSPCTRTRRSFCRAEGGATNGESRAGSTALVQAGLALVFDVFPGGGSDLCACFFTSG